MGSSKEEAEEPEEVKPVPGTTASQFRIPHDRTHGNTPSRPFLPAGFGAGYVAIYYLISSRRKIALCSGHITVLFRIIASAKKGDKAKPVQPWPVGPGFYGGLVGIAM
jgi:hypothetical protein